MCANTNTFKHKHIFTTHDIHSLMFFHSMCIKSISTQYHAQLYCILQKGIDVDSVDKLGNTPLAYAAMNGHERLVNAVMTHLRPIRDESSRVRNVV